MNLRKVMVVIALSTGMVVANAGVAHAGFSRTTDSLEGDPAATWRVEHYGNSNGGFDIGAGLARTFDNNAWLIATDNFSAVGRDFTLPTRAVLCGANIWIASFGVSQVNLEVIDPRTWTGTWTTYTLRSSAYTQVSFPTFGPSVRNLFLRVSLIGSTRTYGVLIDDLAVECTTSYP